MKQKPNTFALIKWIAENGGQVAKVYLNQHTDMTLSSLNRALANKCIPRVHHRYQIYAATGIRLLESDDFPEVEIKKLEAS